MQASKNTKVIRYLLLALAAVGPLFVASKCSPLYPFNDWPDINIFFTMGKGMVHGKVLYADYMDHKGPYVYALFALGYLLSHTTFFGIFLLEVCAMFVSLLLVHRILGLYTAHPDHYLWLTPFFSAGITVSKSFVHGGSAEEFMIPFYLYGLYTLLRYLRTPGKAETAVPFYVNGLITGILFWSKYTVLGFYIAWLLIIGITMLTAKQGQKLFTGLCKYTLGVLTATLPWVLYFTYHHSIGIWLDVYLWNNIFHYATTGELTILQKIANAILLAIRALKDRENLCYSAWIIPGGILYLFLPKEKHALRDTLALPILGLLTSLGLFIGGAVQDYYVLPLSVFAVIGLLSLSVVLDTLQAKSKVLPLHRGALQLPLFVAILLCAIAYNLRFSSNAYLLAYEKEDMPQYRFARIIQESDDPSILNYGFLDGGFYTVLNQVPDERHFCTLNLDYFTVLEKQNEYLEAETNAWVVTWRGEVTSEEELRQIPVLTDHYELVDYLYFPLELDNRTYALYHRK